MRSIKTRAITYARRYPGQSATQIAHALGASPATVSSVLQRAAKDNELWRRECGGPTGRAYTYGPPWLKVRGP